ncbi:1-phosphatidylinositol phosphodiesterase [Enterococcus sp. DIV0421]|uniref:phosphatidylinositol-specific phospholipase C n=1 Tax=Enterococcus sp. DIV0421 TaxID=2774688 RepID=UPI003F200F3F
MRRINFSIILLCVLFFSSPYTVYAHYDRAYWNEEEATTKFTEQYQDWMKTISDDCLLSNISIPGTHDTMAHSRSLLFVDNTRTQSMNLEQQLLSGIRYLDIRLKYEERGLFSIYHGPIYLGYDFDDVLSTVKKFLSSNPSETVLMRVKQENSNASDPEMWKLFDQYDNKYKGLFWNYSFSRIDNPKLGDVRGKVVILSDIWGLKQGMPYSMLPKQDKYHLSTNWDLYSKWQYIREEIDLANTLEDNLIHLNYLSGSGGVFPYFVASGHINPGTRSDRLSTGLTEPTFKNKYPDFPRTARLGVFATISFEGTNVLTADYLYNNAISRSGIIVADFPGERLIDAVIQCNYRK